MIIQNLTFGYVLEHFLDNDSGKAVTFAGIFLLIAAAATMLIKSKKMDAGQVVSMSSGH